MSTPCLSSTLHNGTYRTRYLFNGKELDTETLLYYYGARYFEPVTSLWYGVDPLAEKYPMESPYVYCGSSPVVYYDPNGGEKHIFFDTELLPYKSFPELEKATDLQSTNRILKNDANLYKDDADYIHVFCHGFLEKDKKGLAISNFKTIQTAKGLRKVLSDQNSKLMKNYGNNNVIVLHSCHSGEGDYSFAQEMSASEQFYGCAFIAASSFVKSGTHSETVQNDGMWRVFYKGKEIPELAMHGSDSPWYKFWDRHKAIQLEKFLKNISREEFLNLCEKYYQQRYGNESN